MQLTQVRATKPVLRPFMDIEDAVVINDAPMAISSGEAVKHFIESNTKDVTLQHLKNECIIPVFSKDNEVTISHSNFIETVYDAACRVFPYEKINTPEIRVSHLIKGRAPNAIHKPTNELLEEDKTLYYERMAFCIEIPTVNADINGNTLSLSVGGVRSYNLENLYSKKTCEKFKIFIGCKNLVCCNLCVSTDGFKDEVRVMDTQRLLSNVVELFQLYNMQKHLNLLNSLNGLSMTESQFAQLIGKSRLYQYLPAKEKKLLPTLDFTDSHLNIIAKDYYRDENFSKGNNDNINLWNVYNLFTGANKNSYIDTFLNRGINATDFIIGLSEALREHSRYSWFIE